jgi:hypothetical protein
MLFATLLSLGLAACAGTSADTGTSAAEEVASDETNRDGTCSFNRECPADQRCACSETDGCACADGARGTGRSGVDTCTSGDDCASSLCIESNETQAGGGVFYCSDECATHDDCTGALPVCMDIVYVGRVCVRDGAQR